jgi:hypothetical protein
MAINDFAGPIIQAFIAGQNLKRQREQDTIAAQDRERQIKEFERQTKRQEAEDKVAATMRRFEVENMLRSQLASGQRRIPTVTENLPGGLAAPQMNPIAQQLLIPSAAQELPLQETMPQSAPMQLGQEFALPQTNRRGEPLLDVPGIGQFDLREFPGYEETLGRKLMEQGLLAQAEVAKAGKIAGAQAEAKLPFETKLAKTKSEAKQEEIKLKGAQDLAVAGVKAKTATELEATRQANRLALQQVIANNRKKLISFAEGLHTARKAGEQVADVEGQLELFRNGTYAVEDMGKVSSVLRNTVINELKKQNIPVLSRVQANGIGQLQATASFIRDAERLRQEIERNPVTSTLPFVSERANLAASLRAKIEDYSRKQLGVRGVLTDKDFERQLGILPSEAPRFNRDADNLRRIRELKKDFVANFNAGYRSLSDVEKMKIIQEAGIAEFFMENK